MSKHTHQQDEELRQESAENQESKQNNSETSATEPADLKGENPDIGAADTASLLTELQEKYDTLNDKYLRQYSDFENFRRRTSKEKIEAFRNAGSGILKEFLPVVDDFDRAIASNAHDDNLENVKEGFQLIQHKFMKILENHGVTPMNAIEKPFDTNYHEAITNVPAPNEAMKGKVMDVAEKGYFYHDQVLRYAKVVVGQ
jgi:molecular chaperone GrpE